MGGKSGGAVAAKVTAKGIKRGAVKVTAKAALSPADQKARAKAIKNGWGPLLNVLPGLGKA
jgi:hypothetical protein